MNYPIKIVGFVIDVHNLTMYQADGETITVPQGDARIKVLVEKLVAAKTRIDERNSYILDPALKQKFMYMLQSDDMNDKNYYAEAEKKANGVVRFFRMAKAKVKELVDKFVEPIGFMEVGEKKEVVMEHSVTGSKAEGGVTEIQEEVVVEKKPVLPKPEDRPLTKSEAAVAEIMAGAIPASSPNFNSPTDVAEETTIVAVLEDNTIIPGAEALADQAAAVAQGLGNGDGMANFLRRAGMVKRGHSVEDLLKFVQKGELPLADDGCVLVYKLLKRTRVEGEFVDCHSGRVKQRVGSYVHMDEALVDPRRSQDCSNGLHVARRDYLGSFGGDVCVLAKLAPEDVIAVPQYDARKLRAKAYHIIAELSDSDRKLVCSNRPMEDQVLLGNAIAGNHAEITEYVKITEQKGGGLQVTSVADAKQGLPALDTNLTGQSLDHLEDKEELPIEERQVDARAIALASGPSNKKEEQVIHAPPAQMNVTSDTLPGTPVPPPLPIPAPAGFVPGAKAEPVKSKTPAQKLVDTFNEATTPSAKGEAAKALVAFKKDKKKGWTALGIPAAVWTKAVEIVEALDVGAKNAVTKKDCIPEPAIEAIAKTLPKAKPKNDDKSFPAPAVKKAAPALPKPSATPPMPPVKPPKEKKMTQQEEMAKLVKLYEANPDKMNARAIYTFKQKAKKGWDVLGVTDAKFIKKITERAKL